MTKRPLKVGDRVRHVGHQYTSRATATIVGVSDGFDGTYEYAVKRDDPWPWSDGQITQWNSDVIVYVSWQECPDEGRCWHECGETSCFRVNYASPFGSEDWSDEVKAAHPVENVRPSMETEILSEP